MFWHLKGNAKLLFRLYLESLLKVYILGYLLGIILLTTTTRQTSASHIYIVPYCTFNQQLFKIKVQFKIVTDKVEYWLCEYIVKETAWKQFVKDDYVVHSNKCIFLGFKNDFIYFYFLFFKYTLFMIYSKTASEELTLQQALLLVTSSFLMLFLLYLLFHCICFVIYLFIVLCFA